MYIATNSKNKDFSMEFKSLNKYFTCWCDLDMLLQCFMEPLKKVAVEGHLLFVEPQDLFSNLDEQCFVST